MSNDNIEKQNREYKCEFKDGWMVYTCIQKRVLKNGVVKQYKNMVRHRRPNKLGKRGKDKTKRKPRYVWKKIVTKDLNPL